MAGAAETGDLPVATRWSSFDLLALGAVIIWGLNFSAIKIAMVDLSPMAFNAARFALSTTVILFFLRLRGESFRVARNDLVAVLGLGLLGHTIYQVFFINGAALTSPANASLIMATSPLWVVILGRALGIEKTSGAVWLGVAVSFAGILIFIMAGGGGLALDTSSLRGDLLVLAAAMCWAGYTTFSKPLLTRYSPLKLTAVTMFLGTVPLVLISVPYLGQQDWSAVTYPAWISLLYSAVFSVAVGYVVWYTSVRRIGNARTAVFSNLTPIFAALFAWLLLGYRLYPLQLLGAGVVLAGLMLTRRGRR
jgi:drug/metabolite transporter (DMT)-like permease